GPADDRDELARDDGPPPEDVHAEVRAVPEPGRRREVPGAAAELAQARELLRLRESGDDRADPAQPGAADRLDRGDERFRRAHGARAARDEDPAREFRRPDGGRALAGGEGGFRREGRRGDEDPAQAGQGGAGPGADGRAGAADHVARGPDRRDPDARARPEEL